VNRYHWGFDDPARAKGPNEAISAEFRRVRDQIKLVFEAYAAGLHEGVERNASLESTSSGSREESLANPVNERIDDALEEH
jgi:hypothetical protein